MTPREDVEEAAAVLAAAAANYVVKQARASGLALDVSEAKADLAEALAGDDRVRFVLLDRLVDGHYHEVIAAVVAAPIRGTVEDVTDDQA